jgi:hypothetical protein
MIYTTLRIMEEEYKYQESVCYISIELKVSKTNLDLGLEV